MRRMSISGATVRLLAVALVAAAALVASPAPAATPAETKYANKIVDRVNDIRANNDRIRLKKNACLLRFAVKRAEYLAKHQDTSLPHTNLEKIQKACDVGWVGENLVYGTGTREPDGDAMDELAAAQVEHPAPEVPHHRCRGPQGRRRVVGRAGLRQEALTQPRQPGIAASSHSSAPAGRLPWASAADAQPWSMVPNLAGL